MKSFLTPLLFLLSVSVFADNMRVANTFTSEDLDESCADKYREWTSIANNETEWIMVQFKVFFFVNKNFLKIVGDKKIQFLENFKYFCEKSPNVSVRTAAKQTLDRMSNAETDEIQSTKLEWGRHGDGIEIQNKLMIRKSGVENPFCGSTSKTPVVPNIPINISIIPGNNKSNFHYIGLSSKEINVDNWTINKPKQYLLYFTSGQNWSGVHDSSLKISDWRDGVVPPLKSGDILTIIYKKDEGTIVFKRDDEILYLGNGYAGDLYLSGFVRFKDEGIKIH